MKLLSTFLRVPARMLLLLSGFWISACRENPRQADTVDSEANPTVTEQEEVSDERITALQNEIEEGRQKIENIEAFVQMERAKLEENPDYEQSFMLEALEEQKGIREKVESGEERLEEFSK
jgi:uncharacterized protein YlxW (UPF0749 family)